MNELDNGAAYATADLMEAFGRLYIAGPDPSRPSDPEQTPGPAFSNMLYVLNGLVRGLQADGPEPAGEGLPDDAQQELERLWGQIKWAVDGSGDFDVHIGNGVTTIVNSALRVLEPLLGPRPDRTMLLQLDEADRVSDAIDSLRIGDLRSRLQADLAAACGAVEICRPLPSQLAEELESSLSGVLPASSRGVLEWPPCRFLRAGDWLRKADRLRAYVEQEPGLAESQMEVLTRRTLRSFLRVGHWDDSEAGIGWSSADERKLAMLFVEGDSGAKWLLDRAAGGDLSDVGIAYVKTLSGVDRAKAVVAFNNCGASTHWEDEGRKLLDELGDGPAPREAEERKTHAEIIGELEEEFGQLEDDDFEGLQSPTASERFSARCLEASGYVFFAEAMTWLRNLTSDTESRLDRFLDSAKSEHPAGEPFSYREYLDFFVVECPDLSARVLNSQDPGWVLDALLRTPKGGQVLRLFELNAQALELLEGTLKARDAEAELSLLKAAGFDIDAPVDPQIAKALREEVIQEAREAGSLSEAADILEGADNLLDDLGGSSAQVLFC